MRPMSITGIACSLTALLSLSGAVQAGHDGADVLAPLPADRFTQADARHLLLRAGFGGSIEEVQRLHRLGASGAAAEKQCCGVADGRELLILHRLAAPRGSTAGFPPGEWYGGYFIS